jgi:hypothetical protein
MWLWLLLALYCCRRLRKAVKQLLQEAHAASQSAGQALDASLAAKLGSTKLLKDELAAQVRCSQEQLCCTTSYSKTEGKSGGHRSPCILYYESKDELAAQVGCILGQSCCSRSAARCWC